MKYLRNVNGQLYCTDCKSYTCTCLPETKDDFDMDYATIMTYRSIVHISSKCDLILLKKQVLPNGKIISSGTDIYVPISKYIMEDKSTKTVIIDNRIINKIYGK